MHGLLQLLIAITDTRLVLFCLHNHLVRDRVVVVL